MADKEPESRSREFVRSAKPENYTYFGAVMSDLLSSRNYSQSSFARECQEQGHTRVTQNRISRWWRLPVDDEGNAESLKTEDFCDAWFPPVADEILDFDDEELVNFALAFTYGQQIPRDRRLRQEPMQEGLDRRAESEPADISEAELKGIGDFRRYYREVVSHERSSERDSERGREREKS